MSVMHKGLLIVVHSLEDMIAAVEVARKCYCCSTEQFKLFQTNKAAEKRAK